MHKHFFMLVLAATAGLILAKFFGGTLNLGSLLGGSSTTAATAASTTTPAGS
jgi:hypothetical protein